MIARPDGVVCAILFKAQLPSVLASFNRWGPTTGYFYYPTGKEVLPGFPQSCATPPTECVFIDVTDTWTVFLDNNRRPDTFYSALCSLSEDLRTVALGLILRYQAPITSVMATRFQHSNGTSGRFVARDVAAVKDGKSWEFWNAGNPLSFEDLGAYKRRKVADRLTDEMVIDYCRKCGIDLEDASGWDFDSAVHCRRELRNELSTFSEADLVKMLEDSARRSPGGQNVVMRVFRRFYPSS